MVDYILFFILLILFFIMISREIFFRKGSKVKIKSLNTTYKTYILLSLLWLFLGYSYIRVFNEYNLNSESFNYAHLLIGILYGVFGLSWLIKSFLRDLISDKGIITHKGNYKWHRVSKYKWSDIEEINIKKEQVEYSNLTIQIDNSRMINLMINELDKDNVQKLLDINNSVQTEN